MVIKRKALLLALIGGLLACIVGCVGCVGSTGSEGALDPLALEAQSDDWVVVHYDNGLWDVALDVADALLATEVAANEALAAANRGWIDGNGRRDVVRHLLQWLRRAEMWATLEPIFATASLKWTRLESRTSLGGSAAVELSR